MLDLRLPPESFDAVICVFGIFFVPDMGHAARELWSFVRPGGQLAVTTWGPRFFEPVNATFWNSVGALRPELSRRFNPWDRISEPGALRDILASAGVQKLDVVAVHVQVARSRQHHVHLFVARLRLVVLRPREAGRHLDLVQAEGLQAERDRLARDLAAATRRPARRSEWSPLPECRHSASRQNLQCRS
jgi:SAM-dependent methyltransferase